MTKKDYIKFAEMIKTRKNELIRLIDESASPTTIRAWEEREQEVSDMSILIADIFADDNPRFDRSRFLRACGLE